MKTALQISLVLSLLNPATAAADNLFDQTEDFRQLLKQEKVLGNRESAKELGGTLIAQLDERHPEREVIQEVVTDIRGSSRFPVEHQLKFITGRKEEIYCRGIGLVHAQAFHNDDTQSEIKLIDNNRQIAADSYNSLTGGQWTFELDTAYREPVVSTVEFVSASANSISLKETRDYSDGKQDRGEWSLRWSERGWGGNTNSNTRNLLEPAPLYMASEYHLWGTHDFGRRLVFQVGHKDQVESRESLRNNRGVVIKTQREVAEHLGNYRYSAQSRQFEYSDCYKVNLKIEFDRYEEN